MCFLCCLWYSRINDAFDLNFLKRSIVITQLGNLPYHSLVGPLLPLQHSTTNISRLCISLGDWYSNNKFCRFYFQKMISKEFSWMKGYQYSKVFFSLTVHWTKKTSHNVVGHTHTTRKSHTSWYRKVQRNKHMQWLDKT